MQVTCAERLSTNATIDYFRLANSTHDERRRESETERERMLIHKPNKTFMSNNTELDWNNQWHE